MLPRLDISWVGRPNHQKTGGSRPNSEGFDIQSVGQDFRLFSRFIVVPCDQNLGSRPGDRLTLCDIMVYKGGVRKANEAERQWRLSLIKKQPVALTRSGKRTKPKGNGDIAAKRADQDFGARSGKRTKPKGNGDINLWKSRQVAGVQSGKRTKPKGNGDRTKLFPGS